MHLLADGVVLRGVGDELAEPAFEHARLLAQRHRLALGERNRPAAMRMRHLERFEEFGVLVEELRICAQEASEIVGVHGSLISSVPS